MFISKKKKIFFQSKEKEERGRKRSRMLLYRIHRIRITIGVKTRKWDYFCIGLIYRINPSTTSERNGVENIISYLDLIFFFKKKRNLLFILYHAIYSIFFFFSDSKYTYIYNNFVIGLLWQATLFVSKVTAFTFAWSNHLVKTTIKKKKN